MFLNTTNKTNFSSVFCLSFSAIFTFFSILRHVAFIFILIYLFMYFAGTGSHVYCLSFEITNLLTMTLISDPTASPVYVVLGLEPRTC